MVVSSWNFNCSWILGKLKCLQNFKVLTSRIIPKSPIRIRVSAFFAKSRDFDGGPKTKRGLRINPLKIEFYFENTEFLLDIKFLSLKIALYSDENCGFHFRKWAKLIFFSKNVSDVITVAIFIQIRCNFLRRFDGNANLIFCERNSKTKGFISRC